MNTDLIRIRLLSFVYSAGALFLAALVGVLASEEFSTLIVSHAGSGIGGTLALLALQELVKHLRNVRVLKKLELGSIIEAEVTLI